MNGCIDILCYLIYFIDICYRCFTLRVSYVVPVVMLSVVYHYWDVIKEIVLFLSYLSYFAFYSSNWVILV